AFGIGHQLEECPPDRRIGHQCPTVHHFLVIGEEVEFQNSQAVQFGKQVAGRLDTERQRVAWGQLDLPVEYLLCWFEIEVVEPVEGLVDQGLPLSWQTTGERQEQGHPPQLSASRHLSPVIW